MMTKWSGCPVLGFTVKRSLSNVETSKGEPLSLSATMKESCLSKATHNSFKLRSAASSRLVLPKINKSYVHSNNTSIAVSKIAKPNVQIIIWLEYK